MHCCLAVCAAAKVRVSRALSVPVLSDRRSANSAETTANDRLLHFMPQLPLVEKHDEFEVTSQFVIEVQPFFIRNSYLRRKVSPGGSHRQAISHFVTEYLRN